MPRSKKTEPQYHVEFTHGQLMSATERSYDAAMRLARRFADVSDCVVYVKLPVAAYSHGKLINLVENPDVVLPPPMLEG